MALDIYLQPKPEIPRIGGEYELVAQLEDDGYYWFLFPLWEKLRQRTGQEVDLYGDAAFGGAQLEQLEAVLREAKQLFASQPEFWKVGVGNQTFPIQQEIYSIVSKNEFEKLINKIESAIEKAKAENGYITFWGD